MQMGRSRELVFQRSLPNMEIEADQGDRKERLVGSDQEETREWN